MTVLLPYPLNSYYTPNLTQQVRLNSGVFLILIILLFLAPEVDYLPVTIPLSFEVCDREVCVDIPLINDTILEDTEKFNVVVTELHDTNERIILEERERLYTIVDVDGKLPIRVYNICSALSRNL